jgi:hypothetical protein
VQPPSLRGRLGVDAAAGPGVTRWRRVTGASVVRSVLPDGLATYIVLVGEASRVHHVNAFMNVRLER